MEDGAGISQPVDLSEDDIVFSSYSMTPQGAVQSIRYVLFVPSEGYFALQTQEERAQLERAIGQLNALLKDESYIAVGPGRWGTSTPDLGVHVSYGDIYNARALIELAGEEIGASPEPSFGTHFFQDLMEANIYPLGVFLDDPRSIFRREFFYSMPSRLERFLQIENPRVFAALKLIDVEDYRAGQRMDLVMDADKGYAVAFLISEREALNSSAEDSVSGSAPSGLE